MLYRCSRQGVNFHGLGKNLHGSGKARSAVLVSIPFPERVSRPPGLLVLTTSTSLPYVFVHYSHSQFFDIIYRRQTPSNICAIMGRSTRRTDPLTRKHHSTRSLAWSMTCMIEAWLLLITSNANLDQVRMVLKGRSTIIHVILSWNGPYNGNRPHCERLDSCCYVISK